MDSIQKHSTAPSAELSQLSIEPSTPTKRNDTWKLGAKKSLTPIDLFSWRKSVNKNSSLRSPYSAVSTSSRSTLQDVEEPNTKSNVNFSKKPLIFKLPLTPQETLKQFKTLLTPFEQCEILDYKDVYFTGSASIYKIGSSKRKTGADLAELYNIEGTTKDKDQNIYNNGFDDTRGDLYLTKHDHIAYRYEILSLLGKGSFGQVVKCFDHKRKVQVAVKIIRNKTRFEKQGLVEVKVLNRIASEDDTNSNCLIHVLSNFFFRGHLCFTFELLGINLYEWLKAGSFRGVHLALVRRFAAQMLQCLKLLKNLNIVHCDLKPENVLLVDTSNNQPSRLDSNPYEISIGPQTAYKSMNRVPSDFNPNLKQYDIKVIDFGSSCYESERIYTYVQSRFYRSPEVILGTPYTSAIDVWSFGCILAELLIGFPLFPGENEHEQLACIMEVKGVPPVSFSSRGTRLSVFFGQPKSITNSKGKRRRPGSKTLSSVLKCADMAFIDFLEQCLSWDPEERITPEAALKHPFMTGERFIPKPTINDNIPIVDHRSQSLPSAEMTAVSQTKYLSTPSARSSVTYAVPNSSRGSYYTLPPKEIPNSKSQTIASSKLGSHILQSPEKPNDKEPTRFTAERKSIEGMLPPISTASPLASVNSNASKRVSLGSLLGARGRSSAAKLLSRYTLKDVKLRTDNPAAKKDQPRWR